MNPLELKVVQVILEDIARRPPEQHLTLYKGTIGSNTDGKWESIYTNK
jgi:hypothetical protein